MTKLLCIIFIQSVYVVNVLKIMHMLNFLDTFSVGVTDYFMKICYNYRKAMNYLKLEECY